MSYCLIACAVCWCQPMVISDVTVINPRSRSVQTHRNVTIEGDRIRLIEPAASSVPNGAQVIDGKRKFLIPGLWDAHVHLSKTGCFRFHCSSLAESRVCGTWEAISLRSIAGASESRP